MLPQIHDAKGRNVWVLNGKSRAIRNSHKI